MLDELNKIRNSDFSEGLRRPKTWRWLAEGAGVDWRPAPTSGNGELAGVQLSSRRDDVAGLWTQSFRCKQEQHYRVEAVVSCDCRSPQPGGGLVLSLHSVDAAGNDGRAVVMPPLRRARQFTLRGYYETPPGGRRVVLRIGLVRATGVATVHDVRVIPVMEPEAKSHPWALPALPFANAAPLTAKRICVVTGAPDRPLVSMLRARFGHDAVAVCSARRFASASRDADAVFLLDAKPPAACKSMQALKALAKRCIVIVSLPCIEAISDEHLVTRLIEQIDDPFHARVVHSNFVTAALSLHDNIPFAGRSDTTSRMFQRQFRTNKLFSEYCREHGFEVLLESETDADATSEKPIALLHRTARGAAIVMDVKPAEAVNSSLDEPTVAAHLILAALGSRQQAAGQYICPARNQEELFGHLCDMVDRFPELSWADGARPEDHDVPAMITLGRDLDTVGLPVIPRPVVLIRSGLTGGDLDGVYGVLFWLKQMLRPAPFVSPYAKTWASRYRLAWMPLAAPLATWGGWAADPDVAGYRLDAEFDRGTIAACIDVTSTSRHSVNAVTSKRNAFHRLLAGALPSLARQLVSGRHFYRAAPTGASPADQANVSWRTDDLSVSVKVDGAAFEEDIHNSAAQAGAELIRLELPATHTDPTANSIWRTDWAVMLLEQITGLMLGMTVVNRDAAPLAFEWPETLADLRQTAVMRRVNEPDTDLPLPRVRKGRLTVPPAHALVAVRA